MKTTRLPLLALLALTPACATVATDTSELRVLQRSDAEGVDAPFPTALGPLVLTDVGPEGAPMLAAVDAFRQATGLNVVLTDDTRALLAQTRAGLEAPVEVPPDQVYPFFEGLLARHGYFVAPVHLGPDAATISIAKRDRSRRDDARYVEVPQERVEAFALRHPATLIRTQLTAATVDVRTLATSARAMMTDASLERMMAAGPHGLLVAGTGDLLTSVLAMLEVAQAGVQRSRAEAQDSER